MKEPISTTIKKRIELEKANYFANDNIADFIHEGEIEILKEEITEKIQSLLESLIIDTKYDHNTIETAQRVAKMYLNEVFKGRYHKQPKVTDFPNAKNLDQIYTVGAISVRSACSHHLVPIIGKCWIGVIPSDRVIGLSKFNRIVDWVMSRPQIQEEAAIQLADTIEKLIKPKGLAVIIKAKHQCMTWRGVKDNDTEMVTSVMRGIFRETAEARSELMDLFKGQGYK
ncbi:MAG: GTP cyclohydrolase I [Bacteroidota bacterium]|nr:GTP cyclohydrolase I [Bacteroidota bacterium]